MENMLISFNGFFEKIPDRIKNNRMIVWVLFLGITAFAIVGMQKFKMDMSPDSVFPKDNHVKIAYDNFRVVFGSDEVVYLVYKAKDNDVFSESSLKAVQGIQYDLENYRQGLNENESSPLDHITDITSLLNVSYLEGTNEALISRDFIGANIPSLQTASDSIRKKALAHPDYPKLYLSEDSKYGAILIRTDFNAVIEDEVDNNQNAEFSAQDEEFSFESDEKNNSTYDFNNIPNFKTTWMSEYAPFMEEIYKIINKEKYKEHLEFYPAGNPELMSYIGTEMTKEMMLIILGSLILILGVIWFLFRSFSAMLWSLVIVLSSLFWMLGTIGWSNTPMTDFINIIVFLVIAVGIADTIHILSGYIFFRNKNKDHETAIRSVYKKSGFACFLTSITTALGFTAIMFVPIVSLQRLGIFGAIGVLYAFAITVFMLPLMLDLLSPKIKIRKQDNSNEATIGIPNGFYQSILAKFENLSTVKPWRIVALFSLIAAILLPGVFNIEIDSNLVTIIKADKIIRKNFDVVDKNMAGTGNIEILVDTGIPDGQRDPLVLRSIDQLQKTIEHKYSDIINSTMSLANVAKNSYKVLNEDNPEMYLIPDDGNLLSQTLFLFGSANPKDRRLLVSDDYRISRITINTKNLGSKDGLEFMNKVSIDINREFKNVKEKYADARITVTGQITLFLNMMDLISKSQIQSFGISLLVISVVLLLVLGSLRIGLIAIITNTFPILAVFGLMGLLNIPLDLHTLLVVPIVIGISVDDTIHFLTHFKLEITKNGSIPKAISNTMKEAGQAIIFTSIVLSIGYLIFLFSVNKGFMYFGFLSATAIITALLADLLLLPALLTITKSNQNFKGQDYEN